jgi:CRISPR-associated protein Csm3
MVGAPTEEGAIPMTERAVHLHGRIFLRANIKLQTGLHIGGAAGGLEIGGVDKPVIRNPLNNQPYIPGSSLKGKLRSLLEKAYAAPQTTSIGQNVYVHIAETPQQYADYPICSIFGTFPEWGPEAAKRRGFSVTTPTRLTVRDVPLTEDSERQLKALKTDLPYSEVKWEASIDRVTSAASPRQIERVPAGAVFGPAELVFSVYSEPERNGSDAAMLFVHVIEALEYLEDDYLGGMGTRGNGRVKLTNLALSTRRIEPGKGYGAHVNYPLDEQGVGTINRDELKQWLSEQFA